LVVYQDGQEVAYAAGGAFTTNQPPQHTNSQKRFYFSSRLAGGHTLLAGCRRQCQRKYGTGNLTDGHSLVVAAWYKPDFHGPFGPCLVPRPHIVQVAHPYCWHPASDHAEGQVSASYYECLLVLGDEGEQLSVRVDLRQEVTGRICW
jgi:hypothetical protein